MRLHHQPRALLMEPPATISIAQLHEVHRSVMLSRPIAVIDPVYGRIHQHDAPRTEQRHHSPVAHADIPIDVMTIGVREHTLKVAPLFHHPRREFRSPRSEPPRQISSVSAAISAPPSNASAAPRTTFHHENIPRW